VKIGQYAVRTDPGRKRRQNEDAYVCRPPMFAIADGMGGARAGEIASALAAGALDDPSPAAGGGERRVVDLIQEANRRVHSRASTDPSTSGMGTTMTVAHVERDGTVTFGHVGDSRAYLLRDGRLDQLTDDHSLVAELVRRGELSPAEAESHPQRSVITRALGTDPDVDVDTLTFQPAEGDLFLICSDGLSDMVPAATIERVLNEHRDDLDEAARALIRAANRGGGEDNITAVLFELVADDATTVVLPPDGPTRESTFDEEETLHPEDGVAPPPERDGVGDTMVVSAAEMAAAGEPELPQAGTPEAGLGRRLLALAVIVALAALIVVLVWRGFAT